MPRALFVRVALLLALCALVLGCSASDHAPGPSSEHVSNRTLALDAGADAAPPPCTQDSDCGVGCGVCLEGSCGVASTSVVCRAASNATCDIAEKCDGISNNCPVDRVQPATVVCHPKAGACDIQETCDGAGQCPADAFVAGGQTCRAAVDATCDIAETCTGTSAVCPVDAVQPATLTCRGAAGLCDVAEKCDGAGRCPVDALEPNGQTCRPAVDAICDIAETCNGVSPACPVDAVQPASLPCRAAAGACDVLDKCDGAGRCSADAKQPAQFACRAAVDDCDLAEVCDGVSNACPVIDAKQPSTQVCRTSKDKCDAAEFCSGSADACPADGYLPASTVCGPVAAGDDCDVPENCTGVSPACPANVFKPSTFACRPAPADVTTCDVTEFCSGADAKCPADAVAPNTKVCRPLIAQKACDQVELCDGLNKACPVNQNKPAGSACDDGLGCTVTDKCDAFGACRGTPNDTLCPAEECAFVFCDVATGCGHTLKKTTDVCRASVGACDVVEFCDGKTGACPGDVVKPAAMECRPLSCSNSVLKPAIQCTGSDGKCPTVADQSCGTFACGSPTECRTTCITSDDCSPAYYCAGNDCIPRIGAGQPCNLDAECSISNSHCVDGVCCDTTCVGQCEACNIKGKLGTCVGVTGTPVLPRDKCAADGSKCDGFCDASNRTACQFPNKATSCRDPSCDIKTNAALAESFCTGKGSCALSDPVACEPYACGADACGGDCTVDAQCAANAYCQAGKCTPKGAPAAKCTTDKQCGSGHCADGVCCDTACTGQCEACKLVPGAKAGTCSPVTGDPLAKRPACAAADPACGGACDGKNRVSCIYPAQGKVCRKGACADGKATVNASCDGHGACPAALTIACEQGCEGQVCSGDACVLDADCNDATQYCAAGTCAPKGAPGSACSSATACQTGFCTDGVCCDSACLGQCESCDASGGMGKCSAVPKGDSPHGGRTACANDGSVCGAACDGTTRDSCDYPFDVVCRAGSCAPGAGPDDPATSVVEASCLGNGSCPAEQEQLCGNDGCDAKSKQCEGACAADKNACATAEYCSAGECVPRLPPASACANAAQCASNFCVDGVCCDKRCGDQCAACDVPGSVGTCTPVLGGAHGGRPACGGVGTCGAACDGTVVASCSFAGEQVSCGQAFCSAGVKGKAPTCDGEGVCAPSVTTACKSFACDGAACSTACSRDSDCVKEFECRKGECQPPLQIAAVDRGSCGCSVPGQRSGTPRSVFLLLGLCAAAVLRRRRLAA